MRTNIYARSYSDMREGGYAYPRANHSLIFSASKVSRYDSLSMFFLSRYCLPALVACAFLWPVASAPCGSVLSNARALLLCSCLMQDSFACVDFISLLLSEAACL